jgi:hypothetical protein
MNSKWTRRTFMGSALALAGCATADQMARQANLNMFVAEALARSDRCAVFGTMARTDMMNLAEPFIRFEIREPPADGNGRRIMELSDDLNLAGAWPGSYALSSFYLPANLQIYNFPGWSRGEIGALGRFDVAAGEVIYVGHLDFRGQGQRLDMTVGDRFDAFRADLPDEIAARLQKRLVTLPSSVSFGETRQVPIR